MTPGTHLFRIAPLIAKMTLILATNGSAAQSPSSVWDGIYSTGQAAQGRERFVQRCATCHGEGTVSLRRFDNQSVGDAFQAISKNMPPGTVLPQQEYADILAHLLELHDLPASDTRLRPDAEHLSRIALSFDPDARVFLGDGENAASTKTVDPVTTAALMDPDPGDWLTYRNGYSGWGYSALDQINTANVASLQLAWARGMEAGPLQAEPLVHKGVMYLLNATDVVQALDAANGDLIWEYRRDLPEAVGNTTGTTLRARGLAIHESRLFLATQDAWMIALDTASGKVLWETQRADYRDRVGATAAPLVIGDKVLAGSMCSPTSTLPGGCFVAAYDVQTGEEVWRVYTIARDGQPGDTWGNIPVEERRHASPWMTGTYDPELHLTFWGTGAPAPLPALLRGVGQAELRHTNSTLAIHPDTGEIAWYYQHLPADQWDLDHPFERMVVETEVRPDPNEVPWINPDLTRGEARRVITGIPGKTGILYTLDAATGEFLWARPTTYQNVITTIDGATGVPSLNLQAAPISTTAPSFACPSHFGGKNQPSGAYHPGTHALYMPLINTCMDIAMATDKATGPQDGYAMRPTLKHVPDTEPPQNLGRIEALDVATGRSLWRYEQRAVIYGSILATGGNLIFVGDTQRRFRALHAETGEVEWETILNGNVSGRPTTFAVDGRQYLAIGAGGITHGSYFAALQPEVDVQVGSNTLFVFALPE